MLEALFDTLKTLPLLFAVLVAIEIIEHRAGHRAEQALIRFRRYGPAIGAGFGALPQCGGAVVASELYATRIISIGTLVAVYLATSDEALPIIAANPSQAVWLAPLLATKLAIGLTAGYLIDSARRLGRRRSDHAGGPPAPTAIATNHNGAACSDDHATLATLLTHAGRRGLRVALLLAVTSAILSWLTERPGLAGLMGEWLHHPGLQVVTASSFGLIPSCAPSIALADLFVKGSLSYPALVAGLSANAGAGLTVLLHETDWRVTLRVALLLLTLSIVVGLALTPFFA